MNIRRVGNRVEVSLSAKECAAVAGQYLHPDRDGQLRVDAAWAHAVQTKLKAAIRKTGILKE